MTSAASDPTFLGFASAIVAATGLGLRPAGAGDLPFLSAVYASTRADELRPVAWTDAQKKAFTDWQSSRQEAHYAAHYPNAERLIVQSAGEAGSPADIGRIYVDTTAKEVRLMEVTLLPEFRNRGRGTRLMNALLAYAACRRVPVSLHVEPFNPAKRMYERMNFAVVETRGLYEFMVRPTGGESAAR